MVERWSRFAHSRVGFVLALAGVLALPLIGVVMLRFLLTPPSGIPAAAPASSTAPASILGVRQDLDGAGAQPTPLTPARPTASPSPTPAPSPTPTPTPLGVVNATDGLNVRTEPATRGQILRILPFQTEVRVTGLERQSDGLTWVELESGGWVQARYLDR